MCVVGLRGLWRKKGRLPPRYSTHGATDPAGAVHEAAAARARERRLGLGALGTPAAGLRPRPAREKGFPSNLCLIRLIHLLSLYREVYLTPKQATNYL